MALLEIKELSASVSGKRILDGVSLTVSRGQVHAIMGPNGSGKTSLANVLMGSPKYVVEGGSVRFLSEDLLALSTDQRARKGIFLAFQNPVEISGLSFVSFLKRSAEARGAKRFGVSEFRSLLEKQFNALSLPREFASRDVNHGFSGGEKKRSEAAQLAVLNPKLAVLDEIDSGLDVDTLKTTAREIRRWQKKSKAGLLVMTHYQRLLKYLPADFVHVMRAGKIVESGGPALARRIDREGYGQAQATSLRTVESGDSGGNYASLLKQKKRGLGEVSISLKS